MSYVWTVIVTMAACGLIARGEEWVAVVPPSRSLLLASCVAAFVVGLMHLGAWLL